jgi:hypothetical protein
MLTKKDDQERMMKQRKVVKLAIERKTKEFQDKFASWVKSISAETMRLFRRSASALIHLSFFK